MNIVAIVLARGGSKGIPRKNMMPFCGKPLIQWTLEQLAATPDISETIVSSDDPEILDLAVDDGCIALERPPHLCTDTATSEAAWLHALDIVEKKFGSIDLVVAPQVTSPIRYKSDFTNAIRLCLDTESDSMFSATTAKDLVLWKMNGLQPLPTMVECITERNRNDIPTRVIENGSIYLFRPWVIREYGDRHGDRFAGRTRVYMMKPWQVFEIDEPEDVPLCEVAMRAFVLGEMDV